MIFEVTPLGRFLEGLMSSLTVGLLFLIWRKLK